MSENRTLFGEGRYPDGGLMAILARLGFLGAGLAIVVAVFVPAELVPDFVHSPHLQHFAAFYVAVLLGMAAMPRSRLRNIVLGYGIFAILLEASHLFAGAQLPPLIDNWVADLGGTAAAVAPVVVDRFRRRFPRKP